MVAGPSEVSIVADKYANPDWIAADLIAQAEHDIFAQSILITNNKNLIKAVNECLKKQLNELPKKDIAFKSLKNFGLAGGFLFIAVNGPKEWAIEVKKKYVRL